MQITNFIRTLSIGCVIISLVAATGCTSFRSTIMNRYSNDVLRPQAETRTARGVPVKLKVPTHMEVKIVETYFLGTVEGKAQPAELQLKDDTVEIKSKYDISSPEFVAPEQPSGNVEGKVNYQITKPAVPSIPTMFRPGIEKGLRVLNVETKLIYTEKVFTVDFPRPFAGTLSLLDGEGDGVTFDSEQYFAKIRGEYKEETLSTINSILGSEATAGLLTSASGEMVEVEDSKFKKLTRVVAFDRFDINECHWEEQMQAFVEHHLGACNPPCAPGICPNTEYSAPMPVQVLYPELSQTEVLEYHADK